MRLKLLLRLFGIAAVAAYLMPLSGCNTVEGFGEDVENAGDAIEDEADDRN